MKQTDKVKRYLRWAWYYQKKADFLDEKIRMLRSKAQKMTTSYQDAPVFGGFQDHRQQVIVDMIETEKEYKSMVAQCRNKLQEIHFVINLLEDFQERMVLELRYLYFENWQDIALRLNYHERAIYKVHGRALVHLLEIQKKMQENGAKGYFD